MRTFSPVVGEGGCGVSFLVNLPNIGLSNSESIFINEVWFMSIEVGTIEIIYPVDYPS